MNLDILFRIQDKFLLHSDHQMLLFHTLFHTMSIASVLSLDFPLHLVSQVPVMMFQAVHFALVLMSLPNPLQSSFLLVLLLKLLFLPYLHFCVLAQESASVDSLK